MSDSRIVMTGATGWLGKAYVEHLLDAGAVGSDLALFGSASRTMSFPDGTRWPVRALDTLTSADVDGATVLHLAYLTPDKIDRLGEAAFRDTCTHIDDVVLRALYQAKPREVFISSSGSAGLAERGRTRHPYALAKLEQERRFMDWGSRAGVATSCGRIFNLSGRFIPSPGPYALESFVRQALNTGHIWIEAQMPTVRSYVQVADACRLVAGVLATGEGSVFDLAGPLAVELQDVAEGVAGYIGLNADVIRRAPLTSWTSNTYLGDAGQTLGLAQRFGLRLQTFPAQIEATVAYLSAERLT